MKRLSEKEYWDSQHKKEAHVSRKKSGSFRKTLKYLSRDYSNYCLADILYPKYLPKGEDKKIIEIGCAPGKYLINFHRQFGYVPYGVEYSEAGCETTRSNFKRWNLNTDNIICADFFDEGFQNEHSNKYDIVFSRGFIEHFDNPSSVIDDHINLLKDGGHLAIQIPNLRGLNYHLLKSMNLSSLETHNFSIMDIDAFKKAFEDKNLEFLYCDYVGFFSFGLMNTNKKWKHIIHRILLLIQRPFDFLWRLIFRGNHIKTRYSSPYILFIGRVKKS